MAEPPEPGFAGLLRQLRTEARLTQEELAEAASLSPRSVSDLERGINRTARRDSAELLAGTLGLAWPSRPVGCLWRRPVAAPRPRRCSRPCADRPRPAAGQCGPDARIWVWCPLRNGTRGFSTGAVSWQAS